MTFFITVVAACCTATFGWSGVDGNDNGGFGAILRYCCRAVPALGAGGSATDAATAEAMDSGINWQA
uniref:Putative secreted protein n=1 Tax=Anopheles darlingi TaxID=43151 RepID=A0A2M4DF65_ANODA